MGPRGLTDKSIDLYTAPRVEGSNPLADFLIYVVIKLKISFIKLGGFGIILKCLIHLKSSLHCNKKHLQLSMISRLIIGE